jgi:hypothetical protein
VLTQVTLRCRPRAPQAHWFAGNEDPGVVRAALFRPSTVLWNGRETRVLLEGHPDDVEQERARAGLHALDPADTEPSWPAGPHRGRISVRPGLLGSVASELDRIDGLRWLAEAGVGTVHVACDESQALADARTAALAAGGWLLREAGAPELDGFGGSLPNSALMTRIKDAFDPDGKLSPGRLPLLPDHRP